MSTPDTAEGQVKLPPMERNKREIIRFTSDEDRQNAFQALLDLGEHHQVTMYDPNEWRVATDLVRKLRALGVKFQWLTENI